MNSIVLSRQNNRNYLWPNRLHHCKSNDWVTFQQRLVSVCKKRQFDLRVLGLTVHQPIYLATRSSNQANAKSILIASGFHGEEPAGPWGLLHALEAIDQTTLEAVNVAFLPLVNISGFSLGTRFNYNNENPNRGFLPRIDGAVLSEEGQILLQHQTELTALSLDGALSCHEDVTQQHGYVYANERGEQPSLLALKLRQCNADFFPIHEDGKVDDCMIKNGIVLNHKDSSFEAWLFENGSAHTYCTETPGHSTFFDSRILANSAMIKTFIAFHAR